VNEGARLRDAEKYAQAIASFKRAIALKPSLALAHFNLGYCQYMLKQYALALPAFQQTVKLEPNDSSNHYWLGATYHQLKRYQPALASLQEAIRLKPDDAYSHHWLGDVYAEGFKQYDKAIPEYLESIRLNPQYAIPRNQLGLAYTETDELELALSAFQGAIKLKPAEPLYYSNLGYTYLWMGRREDAVAVQRKLQTLDQAKAKTLADSIEATFPADNDNAGFLGVLAVVVSDRPATALTIYRRILLISTTPDEKAGAYRGMGAAYKAKGNERKALAAYQQALPIYQRLVRLKPNEGYLLSGLARTYVGLGQRDQALQIYKRLQTIAPDHAKDVLNELNKAK
jgi:tetratricopeptide (TPR) repeat protein